MFRIVLEIKTAIKLLNMRIKTYSFHRDLDGAWSESVSALAAVSLVSAELSYKCFLYLILIK